MTNQRSHPADPEPGDAPARRHEDLAALLERLLAQTPGRTQKDLASEAGISYPTLNAWMNRTRGTSASTREFFDSVGRPVPGPSGDERKARLLMLYRQLPESCQRALLKDAEAMLQVSRIT